MVKVGFLDPVTFENVDFSKNILDCFKVRFWKCRLSSELSKCRLFGYENVDLLISIIKMSTFGYQNVDIFKKLSLNDKSLIELDGT